MPKPNPSRKVNLTKAVIEALKPSEKIYVINDAKQTGLCVRVMTSGAKYFVAYRKVDGVPRRMTIGRFPEVTVDMARSHVVRLAGDISKGENPFEKRLESKAEMTMSQLHRRYIEEHAKPHKKSWKSDDDKFSLHLKKWTSRKISTITTGEIQKRHQEIGKDAPVAANRVLSLVSKMFSFAVTIGVWKGDNPCRGIKKFREKSRKRFLQSDEMPKFWGALQGEPNETARDFFIMSLLVGARRSNMLAMRWDEISFDRAEWEIPETKNGESLTVHLPPPALHLLSERRKAKGDSPWVFPSYGKSGHLVEPKFVWDRLLERAGLKDLHIHDLRRTLGSWQAAGGTSLHIIGKSLGHKNVATTQIYARLDLDPVRVSVDAAVAAMMQAAKNGNEKESPHSHNTHH